MCPWELQRVLHSRSTWPYSCGHSFPGTFPRGQTHCVSHVSDQLLELLFQRHHYVIFSSWRIQTWSQLASAEVLQAVRNSLVSPLPITGRLDLPNSWKWTVPGWLALATQLGQKSSRAGTWLLRFQLPLATELWHSGVLGPFWDPESNRSRTSSLIHTPTADGTVNMSKCICYLNPEIWGLLV